MGGERAPLAPRDAAADAVRLALFGMNEDKSTRYQRLQRRVAIASVAWSIGLLTALAWSGGAVALRGLVEPLAGPARPTLLVTLYAAALVVLHECGAALLAFYSGLVLERRYGLSTQSTGDWVRDQAKALVLTCVIAAACAALVYWTIRVSPDWWWLLSGALFAALFAVMANLAPVLLLPLFYTIRPLTNESLRLRLLALAERAGARVLGAYEWGLGDKSRKANAALAGLGSTRRILVSDTMLAAYSEDEIEVVLAHELAHHVHGDIWKGLVFESLLVLAGFFAAAQVLTWAGPRLGIALPSDVAGLPLLLLSIAAISLLMLPVTHAVSRDRERRADRFALELTRNPSAFISAMRRLGQQNLAEDQPSKLVEWLFHSHPPLSERIAAADTFKR